MVQRVEPPRNGISALIRETSQSSLIPSAI